MALIPGTPFEVTMLGTVDGEACYNTWFLQANSNDFYPAMPTTEDDIQYCLQQWADLYRATLLELVGAEISPKYVLQNWKARNLFDPVSLYAGTFDDISPFTGASGLVSTYDTYSLYSPTRRGGQNPGHKSMGGVIEGAVTDGLLVTGTKNAWQQWCDDFLNVPEPAGLTLEYGLSWVVVNVKTIFVPGTLTHKYYYRLPENIDEYAAYVANNWVVQPGMSTRVTRKRGRGV